MAGKNLDIAVLLDFYGEMLTPKQRNTIDLYYNQDLSLAEIAEQEAISRQGVRDSIKRGEVFLYELEDKLHVFENYIDTLKAMQSVWYLAERIEKENSKGVSSKAIAEDISAIKKIIEKERKRLD